MGMADTFISWVVFLVVTLSVVEMYVKGVIRLAILIGATKRSKLKPTPEEEADYDRRSVW